MIELRIDPAHVSASWFLWITSSAIAVIFALPLLLAPIRWAKLLGWRLPEDTALATYLGRCLGGVAVALAAGLMRAASDLAANPVMLEVAIVAGVLLTAVHIWGALERRQPPAETAEILLYAGLTTALVFIYRGL